MGGNELLVSVVIKCPPSVVFDYLADHHHVAAVLAGVRRWEPITSKATGLGARFKVEIVAAGVPLRATLRLDRWNRPRVIGWVSESGLIKNDGSFTFTAVPGGTRLTLRIDYQPPGSLLGAAISRRVDFVLRRRHERALEAIKERLEGESTGPGRHNL